MVRSNIPSPPLSLNLERKGEGNVVVPISRAFHIFRLLTGVKGREGEGGSRSALLLSAGTPATRGGGERAHYVPPSFF